MKTNRTLSALFNVAFGTTVLDAAVFDAAQACDALDAKLALAAGYVAAMQTKDYKVAVANLSHYVDIAADIYARKVSERTKPEQAIYLKANAKYLYYFGTGKASKAGKSATAKAKAPKLDPWAMIVAQYLSEHPRLLSRIAAELGIDKPE